MSSQNAHQLVSIAIATYNGGSFLTEQLDSLLNQSYKNIEIVISDDKSTDNTLSILDEYARKDPRITYSINPSPSGFKNNFNRAISLCKGEIIFLCDQDDIWFENKIEEHIQCYKNPNIQWVYNEVALVDEHKKPIGEYPSNYYTGLSFFYMTGGRCILGCATSYRSNLLTKVLPINDLAPGHDSYIQMAIYPTKSFYIHKKLQEYRQHKRSVTTGIQESPTDINLNIKKSIAYVKNLSFDNKLAITKRIYLFFLYCLKLLKYSIKKHTI
ncbi:MAG: glycosyltransferase [bacterium]